jgi:hypothetical protein
MSACVHLTNGRGRAQSFDSFGSAEVYWLASLVKAVSGAVLLRFAQEMNGDWFPWGQQPTLSKVHNGHTNSCWSTQAPCSTSFSDVPQVRIRGQRAEGLRWIRRRHIGGACNVPVSCVLRRVQLVRVCTHCNGFQGDGLGSAATSRSTCRGDESVSAVTVRSH